MSEPGFDVRLAYARWLDGQGRLMAESDADFAERAGVGYQWFAKWRKRRDAPRDRDLTRRLVDTLGVNGDWLLDGKGAAPEPDLWRRWIAAAAKPVESVSASSAEARDPLGQKKLTELQMARASAKAERDTQKRSAKPAKGREGDAAPKPKRQRPA